MTLVQWTENFLEKKKAEHLRGAINSTRCKSFINSESRTKGKGCGENSVFTPQKQTNKKLGDAGCIAYQMRVFLMRKGSIIFTFKNAEVCVTLIDIRQQRDTYYLNRFRMCHFKIEKQCNNNGILNSGELNDNQGSVYNRVINKMDSKGPKRDHI